MEKINHWLIALTIITLTEICVTGNLYSVVLWFGYGVGLFIKYDMKV